MLVPMTKVHVIGHRGTLEPILEALHRTAAVQLIDVTKDASVPLPPLAADEAQVRHIEDIRYLKARLDGLIAMCSEPASVTDFEVDLDVVRSDLEAAAPHIEKLATARRVADGVRDTAAPPPVTQAARAAPPGTDRARGVRHRGAGARRPPRIGARRPQCRPR